MQCDFCLHSGDLQYRIRTNSDQAWRFACPTCWQAQSQQPGYQYGGTRKANRRQRHHRKRQK